MESSSACTSSSVSWEMSVVRDATGSASMKYGDSFVVCSVHGPRPLTRASHGYSALLDANSVSDQCVLSCSVQYASHLAAGQHEAAALQHSHYVRDSLEAVVLLDKYPKCVISIHLLVMQSSEKDVAALVTCASLALVDATVELRDLVTCASVSASRPSNQRICNVSVAYAAVLDRVTQVLAVGQADEDLVMESVERACTKCSELRDLIESKLCCN